MKSSGTFRIKFFIITLLIISILLSLAVASCEYEDLGLDAISGKRDSADDPGDSETPPDEGKVLTEEFFIKLKAKQLNKNPLNDINIRKAIFHAVDRERIVGELFGEYGEVSDSLFPVDSPYWNPAWSYYDFDPEKAREYLAKAGYGPDNPLYMTIGAVDNSEAKKLVEEIIKEDLAKIGIDIWLFNKPSKEWYEDFVRNGNYEMGLWSIFNSDGSTLKNSFSSEKIPSMETVDNANCENFYWYKNEQVDRILSGFGSVKDTGERKDVFAELQDLLAGDAVVLPLYNRLFVIVHNRRFENIDFEVIDNCLRFDIGKWTISEDSYETGENEAGSEIRIGYQSEEIDLFNSFETYCINDLIFDGLYKTGEDYVYEPVLAAGDTGSGDMTTEIQDPGLVNNLEKTITLKDGIYWDDGTPVTSGDVLYTYDFYRSVLEGEEYLFEIDGDYLKIDRVEIIDEKTFKMVFKERVEEWQKFFNIIIKKDTFLDRNLNYFPLEDVRGCGPYGVAEYDPDSYLLLKVNEYYHGDRAKIENVRIIFDPDIHNLIAMLKEGELDVLSIPVDRTLMEEFGDSDDFGLVIKQGNLLEHLALSLKPVEE